MKIKNFKLERFFAKYEFNAKFLLSSSDCETFSINDLLKLERESKKQFEQLSLGYTNSEGNPNLREVIAKLYKSIEPGNILCFAGAQEGILSFMNCLLDKGDHIIVQIPTYQSLYEIGNSIGCEVTKWIMDEENDWKLDFSFLEENIKPNTKAIIINFPNNPTGGLISTDELKQLVSIAKKEDFYIFSDEVYRLLEFEK